MRTRTVCFNATFRYRYPNAGGKCEQAFYLGSVNEPKIVTFDYQYLSYTLINFSDEDDSADKYFMGDGDPKAVTRILKGETDSL